MATTPNFGLTLWSLEADNFNHTQLANNFTLIDTALAAGTKKFDIQASLPGSPTTGQVVMLSAADSTNGFPAYTTVRWDGTVWKNLGAIEVVAAVPTGNLFNGRTVIVNTNVTTGGLNYNAWDVLTYNGTAWQTVGNLSRVNSGGGALNIQGLQTGVDLYYSASGRGPVLIDRADGTKHRLYINNNALFTEIVT